MESRPQVIHNHKRSFLSTLAIGLSSIIIAVLLGGTAVSIYALRIVDKKSDLLVGTADHLIEALPEIQKNLPPLIGDVFNDERRIDYLDNLEIKTHLVRADHRRGRSGVRAQIEVKNTGEEMVTLMSLHLMALDEKGNLIGEWNEWVATPIAIENELRGPLLPTSKRTIHSGWIHTDQRIVLTNIDIQAEVTDVRIWKKPPPEVAQTIREL